MVCPEGTWPWHAFLLRRLFSPRWLYKMWDIEEALRIEG
jgi:hypothetical protein